MVHGVCEIIASSRAPPRHPLSLFPPVIGVTLPVSSSFPCHPLSLFPPVIGVTPPCHHPLLVTCCHSSLLSLVSLPPCHHPLLVTPCHSSLLSLVSLPLVVILSLSLLSLFPPVIGVTPLLSSSCPCHCCHPPCLHLSVPSIPWGPSFLVKRSSFMWTRGLGTIWTLQKQSQMAASLIYGESIVCRVYWYKELPVSGGLRVIHC